MTFDSTYRRKVLQIWEAEQSEAEQSEAERELSESISRINRTMRAPFQRLLTTMKAWFTLT